MLFLQASENDVDGGAEKRHGELMQFTLLRKMVRTFTGNMRPISVTFWLILRPFDLQSIPVTLISLSPVADKRRSSKTVRSGMEHTATIGPNQTSNVLGRTWHKSRATESSHSGRPKEFADSWFAHAGEADAQHTVADPDVYVAPPLDGIWAGALYLHNGSVSTLSHLMNAEDRPAVWGSFASRMDEDKVGLTIEQASDIPASSNDRVIGRSYFDTRKFGKSGDGQRFPDALSESEKQGVLEFLKTL